MSIDPRETVLRDDNIYYVKSYDGAQRLCPYRSENQRHGDEDRAPDEDIRQRPAARNFVRPLSREREDQPSGQRDDRNKFDIHASSISSPSYPTRTDFGISADTVA